jgi:hypothetical protein
MADEEKKPTLWQMTQSVLAAFFGVQSGKVRERDFTKGNPWHFIIIGIVATTVFVLVVYGVVRLVLANAIH